jgi:MFS family permease
MYLFSCRVLGCSLGSWDKICYRFCRGPIGVPGGSQRRSPSIWAIALCCHAACTNFAGLFVVRLILGMCEGSITAGFMIVSSMFYTRNEQTLRVGYWCECASTSVSLLLTMASIVLMNGMGKALFCQYLCSNLLTHPFSPDHLWFY